jgi:hypothetical protein
MLVKDLYLAAISSSPSEVSLANFFPFRDEASDAGKFPWQRSDWDDLKRRRALLRLTTDQLPIPSPK